MTGTGALARSGRRAAAALLVALAALLALPAQAQTAYVSNTGQDGSSGFSVTGSISQAQGFTTGAQSGGYTLGSVGLKFTSGSSTAAGLGVAIYSEAAGGGPDAAVYTLTNPSALARNGTEQLFTAPANATLSAGTTYYVVVTTASSAYSVVITAETDEDSGASAGWSIEDTRYFRNTSVNNDWGTSAAKLKVSIYPPSTTILSTDATLRALVVNDGTNDLTLTPTFVPGTYTYDADVGSSDTTVTLTATVNDASASVTGVTLDGTAIADTDFTDGISVPSLVEGDNAIVVTVTAEDTSSQDYTVTVTRPQRTTTTPTPPGEVMVPNGWSLIPTGLGAGDKFRLLFLSSNTDRNATSYDIADYNSFIKTLATNGHSAIQSYSDGFRAVGCTPDSDATANTGTTGVGVQIHWLNGNKAADDYTDFYDGDWDEERNNQDRNELGNNGPDTSNINNYPYTGCKHDGTESITGTTSYALGAPGGFVRTGRPNSTASGDGPLSSGDTAGNTFTRPMYGLSQVFEVAAATLSTDATLSGLALKNASDDSAIDLNETFAVGTKSYTAGVANDIDEITVEPASDNNATFAYLDASDTVLTDSDTLKTGFQVDLSVGANTIKVKVTAEDTMATDTYTVVVTRAMAATAPCPAVNDWCGKVTVALEGFSFGYEFDKFGLLDDNMIEYGGKEIEVWTVHVIPQLPRGLTYIYFGSIPRVPRGTVITLGELTYTTDVVSDDGSVGDRWDFPEDGFPPGLDWSVGQEVRVSLVLGSFPAEGAVAISGTAQVGSTLTADPSGITDTDGLTTPTYTYQWLRVDADGVSNETTIGANAATYTLVAADVGKKIKVQVSFTDDRGHIETVTSDATVVAAPPGVTVSKSTLTVTEQSTTGDSYTVVLDSEPTANVVVTVAGHSGTDVTPVPTTLTFTDSDWATAKTVTVTAADDADTVDDEVSLTHSAMSTDTDYSGITIAGVTVTVDDNDDANTPATGQPAITGAAQVGKTLTAGLGNIADTDGLPGTFPDDYTLQWVRVDADGVSNEADLSGETSGTYTPVAADVGKKIKVAVSFTDDGSTAEGPLTSAAYPSNAPVAAAAGACPPDNDWCTTLTVGFSEDGIFKYYGFSTAITDDGLADTTIDDGDGTTWTVSTMVIADAIINDQVHINLDAFLARGSVFDLGGTTFTTDETSESTVTTGNYSWLLPAGFAWVHGQDVTVSVKLPANAPATGVPEISGAPQVGKTLSAGTTGIMDLDGLTSVSYTYQWIRVDVDGTSNPVDVGTDDDEYTLVAADEGKRIKVQVTFTDDDSNAEELTSAAYLTPSHHSYPDRGIMPAQTACPASNEWCATMTVGFQLPGTDNTEFGFSASPGYGALDDTSFDYDGSTFTVENVGIRNPDGMSGYHVRLGLDAFVPRGAVFDLNGYTFTADAAAEQTSTGRYRWALPAGFRIAEGVDYRVSLQLTDNTPAEGKPTISGPAQVGRTLTAATADITDDEGLTTVSYTYQWIAAGTIIALATSATYTPTSSEQGDKITVRVTFDDDEDNPETLTSDETAPVVPDVGVCGGSATWCSTLTVEHGPPVGGVFSLGLGTGFGSAMEDFGSLLSATFTHLGTSYTVTQILADGSALSFATSPNLPDDGAGLTLHIQRVSGTLALKLSDRDSYDMQNGYPTGTRIWYFVGSLATGPANPPLLRGFANPNGDYRQETDEGTLLTVSLFHENRAAEGTPTISGTAQVGETLTARIGDIADADGLPTTFPGDYTFQWVRVDGGTDSPITGATASTYTPVAADVGKKIKVRVSFTDDGGTGEALTSIAFPSSGTITAGTLPALSFASANITVNETAGTATLTVELDPASTGTVTVDYATSDQTAQAGEDYTAASGTLTFAASETSKTITVPILNDTDYDPSQRFRVTLSNAPGATLPTSAWAFVNITNDDAVPTASIANVTVGEGAGTMTLTLALDRLSNRDISYSAVTAGVGGTATVADDYVSFLQGGSKDFTVPAGNLSQTFDITIVDDSVDEPDETIVIVWTKFPSHDATPASITVTVTITDNDTAGNNPPVFTDDATSRAFSETLGDAAVTMASDIGTAVGATDADDDTLIYSLEGTDADRFGIDTTTGQLRTKAGEQYDYETKTSYAVTVKVVDDNGGADTIDVTVNVTNNSGEMPLAPAVPTVTTTPGSMTGLDVNWTAPVNSGRPTITGYDLQYRMGTAGGWTPGPQDISGTSASITDLAEDTLYQVQVRALNEDGDGDWSSSGSARTGAPPTPTVRFGATSYTAIEGVGGATVTVALSVPAARPVTVRLTKTHLGGATAADYAGVPPSVTFAAGETEKTFIVTAVDDTADDDGESVQLGFGALPAGVALGSPSTATVALVQDLDVSTWYVWFGASAYTATEGGTARITLHLNAPWKPELNEALTVPLFDPQHRGGASADDYSGVPESVTFGPGQTRASFTVRVTDDSDDDDGESVLLAFRRLFPDDLEVGRYGARATTLHIADNDGETAVTVSFDAANYTAVEDGATATVRLLLNAAPGRSVTIPLTKTHRGATAADYSGLPGSVTFGPSETEKTLTVTATDDSADDDRESVAIGFGSLPSKVSAGSPSEAVLQLTDNDAGVQVQSVQVRFDASAGTVRDGVEEGGSYRLGIRLSANPGQTLTIPLKYDYLGGATAADFEDLPANLTFGANATSSGVTIRPVDDFVEDPGESLKVSFGSLPAGVSVSSWSGRSTIIPVIDDDAPPGLSVADASAREWPNKKVCLVFEVTMDRMDVDHEVSVDYATRSGTAVSGQDFKPISGTLVFRPSESRRRTASKNLCVEVIDDSHDEGVEEMTLVLSNPVRATLVDGTGTGYISNTDPMPQAWLGRFGRTVANHALEAVGERLSEDAGAQSHMTLGGWRIALNKDQDKASADKTEPASETDPDNETDPTLREGLAAAARQAGVEQPGHMDGRRPAGSMVESGWETPGNHSLPGVRALLLRSSFRWTSAQEALTERAVPGVWTTWGRARQTSFNGRDSDVSVGGEVTTYTLGADYERGRLLAGVALARSDGDGDFTALTDAGTGELDSSMTSVHPYVRYVLSERLEGWGMLGYGRGEMQLSDTVKGETVDMATDIDLRMGALGLRGAVWTTQGLQVALRSDAFWVQTGSAPADNLVATRADVSRVRLVLEGKGALGLPWGAHLAPSVELGLRYDEGDAETGIGVELGGGLQYAGGRLNARVTARTLLAHEDGGYREWGIGGSLGLSAHAGGRGLALSLSSQYGMVSSGVNALWARQTAAGLANRADMDPVSQYGAELSYGLVLPWRWGLLTPYSKLDWSGDRRRALQLGARLTQVSGWHWEMAGQMQEQHGLPATQGVLDYQLSLNARRSW